MPEAAIVLFVLCLPAVLLAGIVIGCIAFARSRRLERELSALREDVRRMQRTLATSPSGAGALSEGAVRASATSAPAAPAAPAYGAPAAPARTIPIAPSAPAPAASHAMASASAPAPAPASATPLAARSPIPAATTPATTPSPAELAGAPPAPLVTPHPLAKYGAPPVAHGTVPPSSIPPPVRAAAPAPKPKIPIEKIIGVTGAAVVGGILLAIAGFVFYRYSVQHGWITPVRRVMLGVLLGVACLVGSAPLRRRGYAITADAIAGAGVVVLYAALWSASALFHIWPMWISFVGMGVVTASCCFLAWRHSSQLIATLGLMGGFATPIVLATGEDRPIGLFGYTLLVNLGFLAVAHRRRWPWLGMLALGGTLAIEALWVFARLDGGELALGLIVLGIFSALFVGLVAVQPDAERRGWMASAVGAIVAPFAFALYFVGTPDLAISGHLAPTAGLAALLSLAAGWLARREGQPLVPLGTSAGSVVVVLVWALTKKMDAARAWELVACTLVLALVSLLHVELVQRRRSSAVEGTREREEERARALFAFVSGVVATLGLLGALMLACLIAGARSGAEVFWPWVAGSVALALVAARLAARTGQEWLTPAAALACGLVLSIAAVDLHGPSGRGGLAPTYVHLLAAAVFGAVILVRRAGPGRSAAAHALALVCLCGFAGLDVLGDTSAGVAGWGRLALQRWTLLGLAIVLAGQATRMSAWFLVALVATLARQMVTLWTPGPTGFLHLFELREYGSVVVQLLATPVVLALPGVPGVPCDGFWARVRALALLPWLAPLIYVCGRWTEQRWPGLPFALVGVVAALFWVVARVQHRASGSGERARVLEVSRRWHAVVALSLVLASVAFQLDHQPWLVAGVLVGAGWTWMASLEKRQVLAIAGVLLLGACAAVSILIRVNVEWSIVGSRASLGGWLTWMYLAPAVAALLASIWTRRAAVDAEATQMLRPFAMLSAIAATVLVFAWLHLTLLDAFGSSPTFAWPDDRMPTRDLTISLAWASYAIALLLFGVSRNASGPRWASLVLLLITLAKVFLFDLGNLSGLYLVASLAGLALSLFAVSLLYQRFVFRRAPEPPSARAPEPEIAQAPPAE